MARFDLTDFEWSVIQPLLPNKVRGVARVDDRRVLNGIFWRLRTGAPWADIPDRYGNPGLTMYQLTEKGHKVFTSARLTDSGRRQLEVETAKWERLSAAVSQILATA